MEGVKKLFRGHVPLALTPPPLSSLGDKKYKSRILFYTFFIRSYTQTRGDNTEKFFWAPLNFLLLDRDKLSFFIEQVWY